MEIISALANGIDPYNGLSFWKDPVFSKLLLSGEIDGHTKKADY